MNALLNEIGSKLKVGVRLKRFVKTGSFSAMQTQTVSESIRTSPGHLRLCYCLPGVREREGEGGEGREERGGREEVGRRKEGKKECETCT